MANVRLHTDKTVKVLYRINFTFNDDYRPKEAGIYSVSIVVEAADKFDALKAAWDSIKVLNVPEPTNMDVKRVEVCE